MSGIDISHTYIEHAENNASEAGFHTSQYEFQVMDAHSLQFSNNSFDIVLGRGVLHHLDIQTGLNEVHRVLKPNGRALFIEPLGANPLLKLFRVLTPRARTKDEKPLLSKDFNYIDFLWYSESTYYGVIAAPIAIFSSIFLRPFNNNYLLKISDVIDKKLNRYNFIQPFNQYVLLNLLPKK